MLSTSDSTAPTLFDAGMFIGALLGGAPRRVEARPLVEAGLFKTHRLRIYPNAVRFTRPARHVSNFWKNVLTLGMKRKERPAPKY